MPNCVECGLPLPPRLPGAGRPRQVHAECRRLRASRRSLAKYHGVRQYRLRSPVVTVRPWTGEVLTSYDRPARVGDLILTFLDGREEVIDPEDFLQDYEEVKT